MHEITLTRVHIGAEKYFIYLLAPQRHQVTTEYIICTFTITGLLQAMHYLKTVVFVVCLFFIFDVGEYNILL